MSLKWFPSMTTRWLPDIPEWSASTSYVERALVKIPDNNGSLRIYLRHASGSGTTKHPAFDRDTWTWVKYFGGNVPWGNFATDVDFRAFEARDTDEVATLGSGSGILHHYRNRAHLGYYSVTHGGTSGGGVIIFGGITSYVQWPSFGDQFIFLPASSDKMYRLFNADATDRVFEGLVEIPMVLAIRNQVMPDQTFTVDHNPLRREVVFGDGYRQIAPDGLHNDLIAFQAVFSKLPTVDAEAVVEFLKEHHSTPFRFFNTVPEWGIYTVECDKWSQKYDVHGAATIVTNMRELKGYD